MIGRMKMIRMPSRNGSFERTSGNAAAVPTIVEIAVTCRPTLSVVVSASRISKSPHICRYQLNVQPVIGNVPYRFALKLNSTSRTIGKNRNR